MKLSTWMMNGYWKSFERKWKEFFFFLVSIQSTISISIDLEKSSLSRPADNYVPRGETRWIGEIDRRDLLPIRGGRAGGTNVSSGKGRRIRGGACAVKHEWAIRFIDRDRGDNIPRPRRSKRGKTPITDVGSYVESVWNITLDLKRKRRKIYLRFLLEVIF